jgi:hypothetical protein
MKTKLLFLVVLIAAVVFSCQKKDSEPVQQDVVFSAIQIDPGAGLKSTDDWDWKCVDGLNPVYAMIEIADDSAGTIDKKTFTPAVFRLDGKLYTQAIKLDPGTYWVVNFLIMDDMGTPLDDSDDMIYMATPAEAATFAEYVADPVSFDFTVTAFTKIEIDVEVLCYEDKYYTEFGFFWFNITEIVVREQCFFGDICLKHWIEYAGSNYELQPGDLGLDMVAIIEVKVYKNGVYVETFTNNVAPNYGVGAPLCVTYADNLNVPDEEFTFELYILVKQGNQFVFVLFKTWTFFDDDMIPAGDDGVVDFVLGTCNFTDTDLQLAPWQNLPDQANVTIAYPGALPSYWDVKFNTYTPAGLYDLPAAPTGWMDGWCGDENTTIDPGTFDAHIYGSIYVADWPAGMPFTELQINRVNWLINHLGDYNLDFENLPQGDADQVQKAVWNLVSGATYGGVAGTMSGDAIAAVPDMNNLWYPLPGGWAAVLIVKLNNPDDYQLVFVVVDP